jgi:chromate reductase, NAD(P)H dehydrogenase (quinone)
MTQEIHVVGIPGSLRDDSYNRALLEAAQNLVDGVEIEIIEIDDIPLFDADLEAGGDPAAVVHFKRAIYEADAVLIATPEYQHGVPGPLKNALDWASRPPGEGPLTGKPTAIMGATTGNYGTARAQEQLRQTLVYNNCPMVKVPEVLVSEAQDKVNENGEFVDEATLKFVGELLEALRGLTLQTQSA